MTSNQTIFFHSNNFLLFSTNYKINRRIFIRDPALHRPGTIPMAIESLKIQIKTTMLDVQSSGKKGEWTYENLMLNCIPGLLSSSRLNS